LVDICEVLNSTIRRKKLSDQAVKSDAFNDRLFGRWGTTWQRGKKALSKEYYEKADVRMKYYKKMYRDNYIEVAN